MKNGIVLYIDAFENQTSIGINTSSLKDHLFSSEKFFSNPFMIILINTLKTSPPVFYEESLYSFER